MDKHSCKTCRFFELRYYDKDFRYGCKKLCFKSAVSYWPWLLPCMLYEKKKSLKTDKKYINREKNHSVNKIDIIIE